MKLYCVRHGEAESAEVNGQRPLTDKGRQEVHNVAKYLGDHDLKISHILCSTQLRAQQTAEIFANAMLLPGQVPQCDALLNENASVMALIEKISTWQEDTLLVGHLPLMPRLISGLLIGNPDLYPIVNYPPAGIVCLKPFDHNHWMIEWILNPHLILGQ